MLTLGTPAAKDATRVMLLGSGELGKEVAISLQRYGVEVIAVDRYAGAPAQQVAHRAHVIEMTDEAALKALILKERPDFIVPEIEAIATEVLVELEALGQGVVVPSAKAVRLTMNREGIRRLAAESLQLPTSDYRFVDSEAELIEAAEAVGYPCFVKPIMSSSGKGQSLMRTRAEAAEVWRHAQTAGRVQGGRAIVEGRVPFDYEITLLTVRFRDSEGLPRLDFCAPIGHRQESGDYVESWQPQAMPQRALTEAQRIAGRVVEALGGFGIFGVELFVRGDEVWFSEVSPRPHDTGLVTLVTQSQNEFELHVRAFLGFPLSTRLDRPGASAVLYGGVSGNNVVYQGIDQALENPMVAVRLFGKPESFPKRRMGVVLAGAERVDQARQCAQQAVGSIQVSQRE